MEQEKIKIDDLSKVITKRLDNHQEKMTPYIFMKEILSACDESIEGSRNQSDIKRRHEIIAVLDEIQNSDSIKNGHYEINYYIEALDEKKTLSREEILVFFKDCFAMKGNVETFLSTMDTLLVEKNISYILTNEHYITIVEKDDKYLLMMSEKDTPIQDEQVIFDNFLKAFVCAFIYVTIADFYNYNTNIVDFINKRQLKDISNILMKDF